jgi:hypothetical protein
MTRHHTMVRYASREDWASLATVVKVDCHSYLGLLLGHLDNTPAQSCTKYALCLTLDIYCV